MPPAEFWFGTLGGFLAELSRLWGLRHDLGENLPPYLRSPFFWIMTGLMILSGGALAWVYSASAIELKPLLAVNVGASAPLIIGNLTKTEPQRK